MIYHQIYNTRTKATQPISSAPNSNQLVWGLQIAWNRGFHEQDLESDSRAHIITLLD